METIKELLIIKTNGGKDIFVDCLGFKTSDFDVKKFKARKESDASAHFRLIDGIWKFKDFGTSYPETDAIGMYAEQNNLTYREALYKLATMYGISDSNSSNTPNKPRITFTSITEDIRERGFEYDIKDQPTKAELAFLGPHVTKEVCEALHYKSVSCYKYIKEDHVVNIFCDSYNMFFRRECHKLDDKGNVKDVFYKNYQPRSDSYKFTYQPSGMSPGECIHGEYELQKEYEKFNEEEERQFNKLHPNGVYKKQKLKDAIICSGERDALCVKAMGHCPIWLNSESQMLTDEIINRIKKYVYRIYFIPDSDEPGLLMGRQKAFEFPELYTVWLPRDEMNKRYGDQHKRMKDFRDWCELHRKAKDFQRLLNNACPLKFWSYEGKKIVVNSSHLFYFLSMYGFYKYKDQASGSYLYVHIIDYEKSTNNHIIEKVTLQEVRDFILRWMIEHALTEKEKHAIMTSQCTKVTALADLYVREFNFKDSTIDSQICTYPNVSIKVNAEEIRELAEDEKSYILKEKVVNHNVTLLNEPLFTYSQVENPYGSEPFFNITVVSKDCKLLTIIERQCNIHWRKSIERGEELTAKELYEYKQNLQSTFFTIGYLLHRHKDFSHPWMVIHQDWKLGKDANDANGRNGKSFARQFLTKVAGLSIVDIKIKKQKPLEYQHVFGSVKSDTDIIYIDEVPRDFDYSMLNEESSTHLVVNPKGLSEYTLEYGESPKFLVNTNYPVLQQNASAEGRQLDWVTSDFYHQKTSNNGYKETRKIYDEFNQDIFGDDYSEEDWNLDINFLLQCLKFYFHSLSVSNDKLTPPMSNIEKRIAQANLAPGFDEFANDYFGDGTMFNKLISKANLTQAFNTGKKTYEQLSDRKVKENLKAWTSLFENLEFNPDEVCTDKQNHRIKRIDGEYFYIRRKDIYE